METWSKNWRQGISSYWEKNRLTEEQINEIRSEYAKAKQNGEIVMNTLERLARKYGKAERTIESVVYKTGNYKELT
ncbi:MAG TPA: hypothetical protein VEA37_11705 [Flavobacterium sp.]|nr:hypothetical protein [Flavobacterium sp.]